MSNLDPTFGVFQILDYKDDGETSVKCLKEGTLEECQAFAMDSSNTEPNAGFVIIDMDDMNDMVADGKASKVDLQ